MANEFAKGKPGNPGFQKGKSGNPGGRPKIPPALKDLARSYTIEAIEAVVKVLRKPKASDAAKLKAAELLIERGYGRPETTVNVRRITSMADLSDDEVAALAAEAEHRDGTRH